jgi:yeast amino acid transporter
MVSYICLITPCSTTGWFLFTDTLQCIALSGTLGVGLYVQGGAILRLGGPISLLLSYFIVALIAWSVMQGVAELLCIWPISGALHRFVGKFVDKEIGIATGVAYW